LKQRQGAENSDDDRLTWRRLNMTNLERRLRKLEGCSGERHVAIVKQLPSDTVGNE
jgi:hypothetical protein